MLGTVQVQENCPTIRLNLYPKIVQNQVLYSVLRSIRLHCLLLCGVAAASSGSRSSSSSSTTTSSSVIQYVQYLLNCYAATVAVCSTLQYSTVVASMLGGWGGRGGRARRVDTATAGVATVGVLQQEDDRAMYRCTVLYSKWCSSNLFLKKILPPFPRINRQGGFF